MKHLILIAALVGLNAHGLQLDDGDNKTVYIEDGKHIDAIQAFRDAMNDKKVLACKEVEAVGNKRTGKVTLKNKK